MTDQEHLEKYIRIQGEYRYHTLSLEEVAAISEQVEEVVHNKILKYQIREAIRKIILTEAEYLEAGNVDVPVRVVSNTLAEDVYKHVLAFLSGLKSEENDNGRGQVD